jgi:hypothetical protein
MTAIDDILFGPIIRKFQRIEAELDVHNIISYHFLGQPNNETNRRQAVLLTNTYLSNKGLYEYMVVCDQRNNNTADIIAKHFIVDVFYREFATDMNMATFRVKL